MKLKLIYKLQLSAITIMLLITGLFFGMAYSDYQHELIRQAELANTVKLLDCLQGKIKCKVMILPVVEEG